MTAATLTPPINAPQLPARVGPLRSVQQTCSLAWRTLVQIKHNPFELVDFSVQPVMFLLLFVYVFGGAIGSASRTSSAQPRPADLDQAPGSVTDLDRPEHGDPHALILPAFARSHRIHSPCSQRIQRSSESNGPANPTVQRIQRSAPLERDQPPVPAVITLTESSLTADDEHPVDL
jgi:hypothetical protein